MRHVLLICAFFLCLIITFDLFLKEPPVWPDEAGLAQFSVQAGKDPLNYYSFYPSIYIVGLSSWFNIFGVSIVNQRLFSIFGGLLTITVFVLIINNLNFKNTFLKTLALVLLITDFTFLQSTRTGRPEIWTLLFGLLSIYFFQKFMNSEFKNYILLIISFFTSFVSFLFHANGIIFIFVILLGIVIYFKSIFNKNSKIVILFIFIVLPFAILVASRLHMFISYILLRLKIGFAQETWLFAVFDSKPAELKLIYLSLISATVAFIIYVIKNRQKKLLLFLVTLLSCWVVMIINKDFWYAVYIIPFVIIALMILFNSYYGKFKSYQFTGLIIIYLILFLSNLKFHYDILLSEGGDKYSYEKFISDIQNNIPDNKTVFNSAIPDTYFAFVGRNNKYEGFPQSFVDAENYLNVLNNTDYIIFNGSFGDNYFGDIVARYIDKNKSHIVYIGEPDQYQAYVVELKSKDKRENP